MPSPPSQRRRAHDGPVRYGIIGTGMMGVEHITNIAAIDGAEVVAVADPDEGSLAAGVAAHVDVLLDVLETDAHALVEKCCHFFDLMNPTVGERPTRVLASGAQDVNHRDEVYDGRPSDILDNAYVIVEYPSGARACLDLCMFADATHDQEAISVVGEHGKLEALIPSDERRIGRRGEHWIGSVERWEVEPDAPVAGLHHGSSYHEHVAFLHAIPAGTPPPVTLDDGLWSVAVGGAAHRSTDKGRAVLLEEVLV